MKQRIELKKIREIRDFFFVKGIKGSLERIFIDFSSWKIRKHDMKILKNQTSFNVFFASSGQNRNKFKRFKKKSKKWCHFGTLCNPFNLMTFLFKYLESLVFRDP